MEHRPPGPSPFPLLGDGGSAAGVTACPEAGSAQSFYSSSPVVSVEPISQMEMWRLSPLSQVTEVVNGHHAWQPALPGSDRILEALPPPSLPSGAPPKRPRLEQAWSQLRPPG